MHGHVVTHSEHFAIGIVNGAGIISAFFDIWRKCGAPKDGAHFFRDGMEHIFKYFEPRGVGLANRLIHKILGRAPIYLGVNKSWL